MIRSLRDAGFPDDEIAGFLLGLAAGFARQAGATDEQVVSLVSQIQQKMREEGS